MTEQERLATIALESKQINDAGRVKQFLEDTAVQEALKEIQKAYFDEFYAADGSPEALQAAWSKSQALSDFNAKLRAILGRGEMAEHSRSIREAQEAASRRATPRK